MDILSDEHARGLIFASMNAVMRRLGLIEETVHCRGDDPPKCAVLCLDHLLKEHAGKRIALQNPCISISSIL